MKFLKDVCVDPLQNCKHPSATVTSDTNEDGAMAIFNCPDCGLNIAMYPKQYEEYMDDLK